MLRAAFRSCEPHPRLYYGRPLPFPHTLQVPSDASLRELRAAAANVASPRNCPSGFRWEGDDEKHAPLLHFGPGVDVAGALQALQPLLAAVAPRLSVSVEGAWSAALVRALDQAVPLACDDLALGSGGATVPLQALEQVVASLPWVRRLELEARAVRPEDVVVGLAWAVARANGGEGGGGGQRRARAELREVVVLMGERREGGVPGWEEHAVSEVAEQLAGVGVALTVVGAE